MRQAAKTWTLFIALSLILCTLCGCSSKGEPLDNPDPEPDPAPVAQVGENGILLQESWGDYLDQAGQDGEELANRLAAGDLPVRLRLNWFNEGGVNSFIYRQPELILDACNALAALSLGQESDISVTDDSTGWEFTFSDGTQISFGFEHGRACVNGAVYDLKNSSGFASINGRVSQRSDEMANLISREQYDALKEGDQFWDLDEEFGDPYDFEHNDDWTSCTAYWIADWDDLTLIELEFKIAPDSGTNDRSLVRKNLVERY